MIAEASVMNIAKLFIYFYFFFYFLIDMGEEGEIFGSGYIPKGQINALTALIGFARD